MSDNEEPHNDSPPAISAEAAKELNQELIQGLIAGLLSNSEVDLMSLLPPTYKAQMRDRPQSSNENAEKSKLAKLNQHWFRVLLSRFGEDPTTDLLEPLEPKWYGDQRQKCLPETEETVKRKKKRKAVKRQARPFYASLDESTATSFEVIEPLSGEVTDMLQPDETANALDRPAEPLKRLIRESRCLFVIGLGGGFVAKLNERMVVKVIGSSQINHCLALQYLAEHAPEVPIPESHGLIQFDGRSIMFMSYIPGSTLTAVWPTLGGHQKATLQTQLNEIFVNIRQIKQKSRPLGLLDGTGVVDHRPIHDLFEAHKPLHTVAEFEDFIFSYRPWVTKTYVQFLQTLLPASRFEEECVFTHCDVRTDNIMVDVDKNGDWKVLGIIDWEEAGFYPAYWEAAKSTRTFLANEENDWYLMQPSCIAPSNHPTAWLVDRLWEEMVQCLGTLEQNMKKKKGERKWKPEEGEDK